MADEQRKVDKGIPEKAYLLGTFEFSAEEKALFKKHPGLEERVVGKLKRRKLALDTAMADYEWFKKQNTDIMKEAALRVEPLYTQLAYYQENNNAAKVAELQQVIAEQESIAQYGEPTFTQTLSQLRTQIMDIRSGRDMEPATSRVDLGFTQMNREDLERLYTDPKEMQSYYDMVQDSIQAGQLTPPEEEKARGFLYDLLRHHAGAVEQDTTNIMSQYFPEVARQRAPKLELTGEVRKEDAERIQAEFKAAFSDKPRVGAEMTPPGEVVEATRRKAISEAMKKYNVIEIQGNRVRLGAQ